MDYSHVNSNDFSTFKNACDLDIIILVCSIVGGILAIAIIAGIVYYCIRRKLTPEYTSIQ